MKRVGLAMILAFAVAALPGCTSYYRVTDPSTNRVYYTTKMDKKRDGAVKLKDARTGNEVTVQNSEVAEISKEEFETGRVDSGMRQQ